MADNLRPAIDQLAARRTMAAHLWRGGAVAHYWTKRDLRKETIWFDTDAPAGIPGRHAHADVYFGVNPLTQIPATNAGGEPTPREYVRSQLRYIAAVNCFYAELDAKDFVEAAEYTPRLPADFAQLSPIDQKAAIAKAKEAEALADLPTYKARILAHLAERRTAGMPAPTWAWDSGGGYQCVWALRHTVTLTDENRAAIASIQKAWVAFVGADPGAADLVRILRWPGTQNRKPHFAPHYPTVTFIVADAARQYDLELFEDLTAHLRTTRAPAPIVGTHASMRSAAPGTNVIEEYNRQASIVDLLAGAGYTECSRHMGTVRMARPGRAKYQPSVTVFRDGDTERSFHHSSTDPLHTPEHARDAFDVFAQLHHGGDYKAAYEAVARKLGLWHDTPPDKPPHAGDGDELPRLKNWNAARQWVRSVDIAEITGKPRSAARDRAYLLKIVDMFARQQTTRRIVSARQLRSGDKGSEDHGAGGSVPTAARKLALFVDVGLLDLEDGDTGPGGAHVYRLGAALQSCVDDTPLEGLEKVYQQRNFETLPLSTHAGHDAFVRRVTCVDVDEAAERLETAREKWDPSTERRPYVLSKEFARRVHAKRDSLGPVPLLLLDTLAAGGGTLTKRDAGAAAHLSKYSVSRAVAILEAAGLVSADHYTVTLCDGWAATVDAITPDMPTYGAQERAAEEDADARIAYAARAGRWKTTEPEAQKRLRRTLARAVKCKRGIEEKRLGRPLTQREIAAIMRPTPKRSAAQWQLAQRDYYTERNADYAALYGVQREDADLLADLNFYRAQAYAAQGAD